MTDTPDQETASALARLDMYAGIIERSPFWVHERTEMKLHLDLRTALQHIAALTERLGQLEAGLKPFAEAATAAEISGRPPFEFCAAHEYEKARALISLASAGQREGRE